MLNADDATVTGFGREWKSFDQTELKGEELHSYFERYFGIFPWDSLPDDSSGFDLGCGSGRWARLVSERVGTLHCIDASPDALQVARRNLAGHHNCVFHAASVDSIPLPPASMDFGYSLGVLHHVPDTGAAVRSCVEKLKPGAPLLLYLYYAFDDRPYWFRGLWRASDAVRRVISRMPWSAKFVTTQVIAAVVYWPLARTARLSERLGLPADAFPLSFYRRSSFYTMRTDALDRFGTRLEQRFTRPQIQSMMESAGLERVKFSDEPPFWCAVGFRRS
jgi:SAM-dependent methyltransferase